jgi:RNA polymerase sigma factor (sigma-70 family)
VFVKHILFNQQSAMLPEQYKTIPLPYLISESILGNSKMQKILYQRFAVTMYCQCLRYTKNAADTEDVLQEGFIKVFVNLPQYRNEGSFEGWMRKIMTRTALSHLRNNKKYSCHTDLEYAQEINEPTVFDKLAEKDITGIVTKLSPGFKKMFVLHVIEGYNHREIAAILGCTESSSKSQFYRSRILLQKILQQSA